MENLKQILSEFLEATRLAKKDESLKPLENKLEKKFAKIFRKQKKLYLDNFKKYKSQFVESVNPSQSNKILDETFTQSKDEMNEAIKSIIGEAMSLGANDTINSLGVDMSFNLENPRAVKFLEERAADMVTAINETTRERINRIVTDSARKGWSYDKTAKQIQSEFEQFAIGKPQKHIQSRAHLVAITENAAAYEEGNMQAARQMEDKGLQMEKYWSNTGDSKVSDGCKENTGAGWIDLDNSFPSGHTRPPRFPGCRCALLQRRKKD